MEDNLKTASNEDMWTLQTYLDDRVEDEYRFKLALQRQLEQNLGRSLRNPNIITTMERDIELSDLLCSV